tara:strand:+ start:226 stop:894 length:669 start_codon:yes stop_codon:yes gene_type:complete
MSGDSGLVKTMAPSKETTPHPALSSDFYTTVWRNGVDGNIETLWYDDMACRKEDLLSTITHTAFRSSTHFDATTCQEAKERLVAEYAPTHDTDWGCTYTEQMRGWFRVKCSITQHNAVEEAVKTLWETPGGAVLIFFICILCICFLVWGLRCYKQSRFVWPPWQRNQYTSTARYRSKTYEVHNNAYSDEKEANNSAPSSDDEEDVYAQPDTESENQNRNAFI